MYIFSYLLTKNKPLSLLATLILALMPWHLHYSRLGFEAITLPALFLLGLIFHFKNWPMLTGLAFGLGFYSYTTARLWALLMLLILRPRWLAWLSFGLLLLPLLSWNRQFPASLTARFNQISVFADHPSPTIVVQRIVKTYLAHFNPQFLFNKGDTTLRHGNNLSSEMLIIWLPFFISGLLFCRKQKLILTMIILFPLAAALTQTSPIATRTIQAAPFFALVIAHGVYCWRKPIIIVAFLLLTALEFNHYYRDLIYAYPQRVSQPWHGFDSQLGPAIKSAYQISQERQKELYLSDKIEQAYIQGLFFTRADPRLWQTRRQAPFTVTEFKILRPNQVWVITKDECSQKDQDYCVVTD